jgi:hypothetical protein
MPTEITPSRAARHAAEHGSAFGLLFVGTVLVLLFAAGAVGVAALSAKPHPPGAQTGSTQPGVKRAIETVAVVKLQVASYVKSLITQRDQAFRERRTSLLLKVYAPGSPSLPAERAAILELRRDHRRLPGLTTAVQVVRMERASPSQWIVQAVLATGPVAVTGDSGRRVGTQPPASARWRLVLVQRGNEWLLWKLQRLP